MLKRRNLGRILIYKIFYSLDTDPAFLNGIEEGMFMPFFCFYMDTFLFNIILQSLCNLCSKIYIFLLTDFSNDTDSVIPEIHILNIQANTFRNTDTCS